MRFSFLWPFIYLQDTSQAVAMSAKVNFLSFYNIPESPILHNSLLDCHLMLFYLERDCQRKREEER